MKSIYKENEGVISFGEFIRMYRTSEMAVTLCEAAKQMNISQATLCRLEKDQALPSPETIKKLSQYYGINEEELCMFRNYWKMRKSCNIDAETINKFNQMKIIFQK